MNEKFSRLRKEQKQESVSAQHQQQKSESHEFATVEEMLRHDIAQTAVPQAVAARLNDSLAREPKPAKSWWQRFFGKS